MDEAYDTSYREQEAGSGREEGSQEEEGKQEKESQLGSRTAGWQVTGWTSMLCVPYKQPRHRVRQDRRRGWQRPARVLYHSLLPLIGSFWQGVACTETVRVSWPSSVSGRAGSHESCHATAAKPAPRVPTSPSAPLGFLWGIASYPLAPFGDLSNEQPIKSSCIHIRCNPHLALTKSAAIPGQDTLDLQDNVELTVFLGISIQTKRLLHGGVVEEFIPVSPLTSMLDC
ncbi:hypothetical protein VTN00DRAFT_4519 [Thermoascus crustaceus]|uniref:uncharacterized protein n=1 Tax=Thermoascus crustaceus TaxID=5088 RepID=UPI00374416DD